jgi:glycine/D-amino acid oxidase-like deaminating enzyme
MTADVVVIGGGLTGCAAAHACATSGLRVVLVEAERIGHGSAGRTAGLLLPEPGPSFREVAGAHGLRAARHAFEAWRRGSREAATLLGKLGIRCALEARDGLLVAGRDSEKQFQREYEAREQAGLDVKWLSARQAGEATAVEGAIAIRTRDSFTLDPYRACIGLAAAAVRARAQLFEQSHVTKVRFTRKDVDVVLPGARIRADKVIVATGTATREFASLRRHFKRHERYLVLTEPIPAAVRKHMVARDVTFGDFEDPHRRVLWTDDNRIVVGGADQDEIPEHLRQAVLIQRTGQLMYELLRMYPVISGLQPAYGWHLGYGRTADGLMYIGPHRNFPHHLFALGNASDSVTGAFVAARMLVRAVRNTPEKGDDVFSWVR